jgi:hypothetical protein
MDGWKIVSCAENGKLRSPEAINQDILKILSVELGVTL